MGGLFINIDFLGIIKILLFYYNLLIIVFIIVILIDYYVWIWIKEYVIEKKKLNVFIFFLERICGFCLMVMLWNNIS